MTTEYVILVNEQDEVIGSEEKIRAHELGLLHRAFSVVIYSKVDNNIKILLQQRASEKYHCGGLWTNTCCSHPRMNEAVLEAAHRRLHEEMALRSELKAVGSFLYHAKFDNGLTEHELDHVFVGEYQNEQSVIINPEEAQAYRWVTLPTLLNELETTPEHFTPWFKPALDLARAHF